MTFFEDVELRICPTCGSQFIKTHYIQKYCCFRCRPSYSYKKPPRGPQYSPEVIEWLSKRNLENFVLFYRQGLQHIRVTGRFPDSWTLGERKSSRRGLVLLRNNGQNRYSRLSLSPLAIELLENSADVDKPMYGIVSPGHAPQGVHEPASAEATIGIKGGEEHG